MKNLGLCLIELGEKKMKEELEERLYNEFPILYQKRVGFSFEDGWFDIIYKVSEGIEKEIMKMTPEEMEETYVRQAKEKFGTLRFYMNNSTYEIENLIREAEKETEITCEDCGNKEGTLGTNGNSNWKRTICKECREKE